LSASGINPSNARKAQKAAATEETEIFEVIARDWHAKFSSSWADYLDVLKENGGAGRMLRRPDMLEGYQAAHSASIPGKR